MGVFFRGVPWLEQLVDIYSGCETLLVGVLCLTGVFRPPWRNLGPELVKFEGRRMDQGLAVRLSR